MPSLQENDARHNYSWWGVCVGGGSEGKVRRLRTIAWAHPPISTEITGEARRIDRSVQSQNGRLVPLCWKVSHLISVSKPVVFGKDVLFLRARFRSSDLPAFLISGCSGCRERL